MTPSELTDILGGYSGFVPGLVVSLVAAAALARLVGRAVGGSWAVGFALVLGFGLVLSATATPSHEALAHGVRGSGTCDLGRVGLLSIEALAWPGEALLNVLLFMPLGLAVGSLPPSRARLPILGLAVVLPFAIELFQLLATPLGRACQSADVVDNLAGLTVGLGLAMAAHWFGGALRDGPSPTVRD